MLQVAVDNTNPLAFGFEKKVDVFFDNSPVMELAPECVDDGRQAGGVVRHQGSRCAQAGRGASTISRAATAAVEAALGKGKVFLFGPEITFRAQPHGTFKFLFNTIFYGTSVAAGTATTSTNTAQQ